jgi:sugar-specific transcriptional regulator TrmB
MRIDELPIILKELNLSEKEAKIYLHLLKLGQSNVTRLAHDSEINRITTYHILNSLLTKGFVTSTLRDNINNFQAIEPKRIIEILKEKQEKINAIIPELELLKKSSFKRPTVELYEGSKGISALLYQTLTANKEILAYGNYSIAKKTEEYQSLNFRKKRIQKKIKLRGVIDKFDKEFTKIDEWNTLTEIRINKSLKEISTFVQIYNDKVAILTFKNELIGVVIDNKEIADMHRFFFNILWKNHKNLT